MKLNLSKIIAIFCSINVLIFSHKLTLKTVDIAYKYVRMSLKTNISLNKAQTYKYNENYNQF